MTAWVGYLPVPTTSREVNDRSAMTSESDMEFYSLDRFLSTTDKRHDLHLGTLVDECVSVPIALDDDAVAFDGDGARVDFKTRQQRCHGLCRGQLVRIAVQLNLHDITGLRC